MCTRKARGCRFSGDRGVRHLRPLRDIPQRRKEVVGAGGDRRSSSSGPCLRGMGGGPSGGVGMVMILGRGGFLIFAEVYEFIHSAPKGRLLPLPKEVVKELLAAARLSCLYVASLEAPFHPFLYMLDASHTGGAIIRSPASTAELRHESRFAHRNGWVTLSETDLQLSGEVKQLEEERRPLGKQREEAPSPDRGTRAMPTTPCGKWSSSSECGSPSRSSIRQCSQE